MIRRIAAVFALCLGFAAPLPATAADQPIRIMPLGSSTTDGNTAPDTDGGYRPDLWQLLVGAGWSVDFVGPNRDADQKIGDPDHAGFGGTRIDYFDDKVDAWMATYQPDIILMHVGANDVLQDYDLPNAPARLGALIDHILTARPSVAIYVASIGPITANANDPAQVDAFNAAANTVVQTRADAGKNVHFVDNRAAFRPSDGAADHMHLTHSGYSKLASRWFGALTGNTMKRYEAEIATLANCRVLSPKSASNDAKVGYIDATDAYVEFTVNAPFAGDYTIFVRAGNGSGQPSTHLLSVNGGASQPVTYASRGWDVWNVVAVHIGLNGGRNLIRLTHGTLYAELDFIELAVPSGTRHAPGASWIARDISEKLTYAARTTAGQLTLSRQTAAGRGPWLDTQVPLQSGVTPAGTPAVAQDATGRLAVLTRTTDNRLYLAREQSPGVDRWQTSVLAGTAAGDPALLLTNSGDLAYAVRTTDGGLAYGDTDGSVENVPVSAAGDPALALDGTGVTHLFVRTTDNHLFQASRDNTGWHGTTGTATIAADPAPFLNYLGNLAYFATQPDGKLLLGLQGPADWTTTVITPKTDLGTIEQVTAVGTPAVAQDVSGKLVYVARTTDGRLIHGWQDSPGATAWHATMLPTQTDQAPVTSVVVQGDPVAALDSAGLLTYFARSGQRIFHGWQNTPGLGPWHSTLIGTGIA
ncbi:GDSL-type esterase/lipase family protein [Fodinicola acaciae]|uniref:GDSL-type esterase/lipase family protein n=1 Tax=Fodinicola acaciae TaxID=2681555 RepID=UPI0013D427A2|nr:GDSL-type esterase/lipase family protein [Fodinicola acaciae]